MWAALDEDISYEYGERVGDNFNLYWDNDVVSLSRDNVRQLIPIFKAFLVEEIEKMEYV